MSNQDRDVGFLPFGALQSARPGFSLMRWGAVHTEMGTLLYHPPMPHEPTLVNGLAVTRVLTGTGASSPVFPFACFSAASGNGDILGLGSSIRGGAWGRYADMDPRKLRQMADGILARMRMASAPEALS